MDNAHKREKKKKKLGNKKASKKKSPACVHYDGELRVENDYIMKHGD